MSPSRRHRLSRPCRRRRCAVRSRSSIHRIRARRHRQVHVPHVAIAVAAVALEGPVGPSRRVVAVHAPLPPPSPLPPPVDTLPRWLSPPPSPVVRCRSRRRGPRAPGCRRPRASGGHPCRRRPSRRCCLRRHGLPRGPSRLWPRPSLPPRMPLQLRLRLQLQLQLQLSRSPPCLPATHRRHRHCHTR
jgi:hypothetical protein